LVFWGLHQLFLRYGQLTEIKYWNAGL